MRHKQAAFILSMLLLAGCATSPQKHLEQGRTLFKKGQFQDALLQYQSALRKDSSLAEGYHELARTFEKLNQQDRAIQAYQRAVSMAPKDQKILESYAEFLMRVYWSLPSRPEFLYNEARKTTDLLLAVNAGSYQGNRVKGFLAVADNRLQEAEECFRKALAAKPLDTDATAMLAQALMRQGKDAEAVAVVKEALKKNRQQGLLYDVLIQRALDSGRREEALDILVQKRDFLPNDLRVRLQLADYYLRLKRPADCEAELQKVLQDRKRFPEGRMEIGRFHEQRGNYDRALELYASGAGEKGADEATYQYRQASILLLKGKRAEAIAVLNTALAKAKTNYDLRKLQAIVFLDGDAAQAEQGFKSLQQLTKENANDGSIRFHLGRAYLNRDMTAEARRALEESISLDPTLIEPRLALLRVLNARRDFDALVGQADQILAVAPMNVYANLYKLMGLRSLGRFSEARTVLNTLRGSPQSMQLADVEAGYMALLEGKPQQAESLFRKRHVPGVSEPRVVVGLAEALQAQGKAQEARRLLETDIAKSPQRPIVLIELGETLYRLGERNAAYFHFERAMAIDPRFVEPYVRMAQVHISRNEAAKAIEIAKQGLDRVGKGAALYSVLASAYQAGGRPTEAEATFREWMKAEPQNPLPLNDLAYHLAERNEKLDEALVLSRRAVQMNPEQLEFVDTVGHVLLRKGMFQESAQTFASIVNRRPNEAVFRYGYGLALKAQGKKDPARRELEQALKSKPYSAELGAKISAALQTL